MGRFLATCPSPKQPIVSRCVGPWRSSRDNGHWPGFLANKRRKLTLRLIASSIVNSRRRSAAKQVGQTKFLYFGMAELFVVVSPRLRHDFASFTTTASQRQTAEIDV
jgi:hypothetical protein